MKRRNFVTASICAILGIFGSKKAAAASAAAVKQKSERRFAAFGGLALTDLRDGNMELKISRVEYISPEKAQNKHGCIRVYHMRQGARGPFESFMNIYFDEIDGTLDFIRNDIMTKMDNTCEALRDERYYPTPANPDPSICFKYKNTGPQPSLIPGRP